jgi:hypothetical protein
MVWIKKASGADASVTLILTSSTYRICSMLCCTMCLIAHAVLYGVVLAILAIVTYTVYCTVSGYPTDLCSIIKGSFKSSLLLLSKNTRPKFRGDRPELFPDQSGQTPHLPGTYIFYS